MIAPGTTAQERVHKTAVAANFDRSAELWDRLYEDDSPSIGVQYRVFMRQRLHLALDAFESFAGQRTLRVLDIGCGAGKLGRALARRGHFVVGADFSPAMLQRAKLAIDRHGKGGPALLLADAELLPLDRDSFDVVCCLGLLEYLRGDEQILREIDDVLRPGGLLIVTLPNLLKLCRLLDPYYHVVRGVEYVWHKLGPTQRSDINSLNADDVNENRGFVLRRFLQGHLDRPLSARGYRLASREPVGFGPFTVWRRPIGTEECCVRWSARLNAFCRTPGLRWLDFFANRWVFAFIKNLP